MEQSYHKSTFIRLCIFGNQFRMTSLDEILRLKGTNNYTWVYLVDGTRYLISKPLKHFHQLFTGFVRIHKTHMVNPSYVLRTERIHRTADTWKIAYQIHLTTGEVLPWSRRCFRIARNEACASVNTL